MGHDKEVAGCNAGCTSFWCLLTVLLRQVGLQHSLSQAMDVFPPVLEVVLPSWAKVLN